MNESDYIIWLMSFEAPELAELLKHASAEEVFHNPELARQHGFNLMADKLAKHAKSNDFKRLLSNVHGAMDKFDIKFVSIVDKAYPERLKRLHTPPLGLFYRGREPSLPLTRPAVSIIGTRHPSTYGHRQSFDIAARLAELSIPIISGMALGCDAQVGRGALSVGGHAVAVLGNGVDICYPRENAGLYDELAQRGTIMSEYLPMTKPDKWRFPARNRIIAALADALLVTEANERSGTLITANHALDIGIEVFALPGNIDMAKSRGCNRLIRDGAHILTSYVDIVYHLQFMPRLSSFFSGKGGAYTENDDKFLKLPLDKDEQMVYSCVCMGEFTIDEVLYKTGLDISIINKSLLNLELKGMVRRRPGAKYIAIIS